MFYKLCEPILNSPELHVTNKYDYFSYYSFIEDNRDYIDWENHEGFDDELKVCCMEDDIQLWFNLRDKIQKKEILNTFLPNDLSNLILSY